MAEKIDVLLKRKKFLIVAIIVLLVIAVYFSFFQSVECSDFGCFQEAMARCKRNVAYVNEEIEASWGYKILGKNGGNCEVEVTLLQAKRGELGMDKIMGESMNCFYEIGIIAYPEKDLKKCRGLLKESMQEIVIEKLHKYVLENLGKIDVGLNS